MSDIFNITDAPHRACWIFKIDLANDAIDDFSHETFDGDENPVWPLGSALGVTPFPDHDGIEVFGLETLQEFGFARYLSEANGLELGSDTAMLNALKGHVVLVFDTALATGQDRFAPTSPLEFIARYAPAQEIPPMIDLQSNSAQGQLPQGRPPMSPARISGMVATAVLLFLAIFVVLFVWIAS